MAPATLDILPTEVFYSICNQLRPSDLLSLKRTSPVFDQLLDISYWKRRLLHSCSGSYPCLSDMPIDWVASTMERERYSNAFGRKSASRHLVYPCNTGAIDVMHIPPASPNMLLVGDRARTLSVFHLDDMSDASWSPQSIESKLHAGWIWSIKSCATSVVTGSWDSTLRSWNICPSGLLPVTCYNAFAQVLCSSFADRNTVVANGNRTARLFDLRASPSAQANVSFQHEASVLCLECSCDTALSIPSSPDGDNTTSTNLPSNGSPTRPMYLFTGCSDGVLSVWDLRNSTDPIQRLKLDNYPRKMSLLNNSELWIAAPPNIVQIFDVRHGQLRLVYTNRLPDYERGFGDIVATDGAIFISGLHGTVEAFNPTCPLVPMSTRPFAENIPRSPTAMAVCENIVTVGSGDGSMHVWLTDPDAFPKLNNTTLPI